MQLTEDILLLIMLNYDHYKFITIGVGIVLNLTG